MISAEIYESYKNGLLEGDRQACHDITAGLIGASIPIKELYIDLFQSTMYEVGDMWEHDKITPAVEHMATGITEYCMSLAYPLIFGAEHKNRTAVVSCLVNEYHQIGARMVADVFELNGWHGYFLGANTPVAALLAMLKEKKPDIVGLSISIYYNMPALLKVIEEIKKNFEKTRIIVGGQGLKHGTALLRRYPDIAIVNTLDGLEKVLNEYN